MEKLFVVYRDGAKLTVSNKRDGIVQGYFDRNVRGNSAVKSAILQKYPKNDNSPVILADRAG